MNRNVLSELNPSGSDLISTSYFSLLTRYGYMVIAIPINLSVYNCVYVCVCVSGCVCFVLLMYSYLLSKFLLHCSLIIAFILHFLLCYSHLFI